MRLMAVTFIALLACICSVFQSLGLAGELRVGAARVVITPDPLLPVSGGLGPPQPTNKRLGELTARAMVFEYDQTRVAVVSLDLLGFPSALCKRVASRVPEIPAENILIGSSHTHSAPDMYAFPDGQGGHTADLDYIEFVCLQTAKAVNDALAKLKKVKLRIGTDDAKGRIAYNYYAPDLYDRRMSVIQAVGEDQQVVATLLNYAIHPEVLGSSASAVSPDLIGPLCEAVESEVGGMALFMNGAQGGMVTADNRNLSEPSDPVRGYWKDVRSWKECERIGQMMATEALRITGESELETVDKLSSHSKVVSFPVDSDVLWQVVTQSPLDYPHGDDRTISTRVNLVQIGDAHILTIPGEALPNIGFYLKRKMRGQHNLLFGLTNDALGYILTKVDFNSFPRYDYVSRTSLGEMTGEIYMESALELIQTHADTP